MKKLFIGILSLALITSCTLSDQENNGSEITAADIDPENPPVITFDSKDFNFGEIAVGATIEHEFKFTNTGNGNLIIHDAKPSCGCTALKNWPKGAIQPGEGGIIPIEFTPNVSGEVTKTVSVITNCNPSVIKLQIKGTVIGG
jgi:hypothetical protein